MTFFDAKIFNKRIRTANKCRKSPTNWNMSIRFVVIFVYLFIIIRNVLKLSSSFYIN